MTQSKTSHADPAGVPGLSKVHDLISAYFSMWDCQVRTLNEVWTDCTCPEATAADVPKAWNKLLRTWTDSAEAICDLYLSHGGGAADGGSPFVTFVIDRSADTDAQAQTVPLPAGVDRRKLVATPLVSLTEDGHRTIDSASIQLVPVDGRIEIRVAIKRPPFVQEAPSRGHYLSVVCQPKAGEPTGDLLTGSLDPPQRPVVATVLVVFI